MEAKFIGLDGSMGLVNGRTYDIDIHTRDNMIYVAWLDGFNAYSRTWCPYSSIESLYANWQMRERRKK